ncbi:alpha-1,2-fucosyltransferase [Polynucleobacter paneuropaeus]|nr:alpha-1,2-fucosyltransferase [Polynucleobacter paneuropaeus]
MPQKKLIVRLKGGLGNQLFSYAASRRLSIVNNAELVIDDVTGFKRDFEYKRNYSLDNFNIPSRKATSKELLEPFGLIRRRLFKYRERLKSFENRIYIEQEFPDFDPRLINLELCGDSYIDGLWQSEGYFSDIEDIIRRDLKIKPPLDDKNQKLSALIKSKNSIGIHLRRFIKSDTSTVNLASIYYDKAIKLIKSELKDPYYVVFSDDIEYAREIIEPLKIEAVYVGHNISASSAYADLWLMSICKHFIMANSTFSWWGAWLGGNLSGRLILFPRLASEYKKNWAWDYKYQMPKNWREIGI